MAREVSRRLFSRVIEVKPGSINVQPQHPGLPGNPCEIVKGGDFFDFRADWSRDEEGLLPLFPGVATLKVAKPGDPVFQGQFVEFGRIFKPL